MDYIRTSEYDLKKIKESFAAGTLGKGSTLYNSDTFVYDMFNSGELSSRIRDLDNGDGTFKILDDSDKTDLLQFLLENTRAYNIENKEYRLELDDITYPLSDDSKKKIQKHLKSASDLSNGSRNFAKIYAKVAMTILEEQEVEEISSAYYDAIKRLQENYQTQSAIDATRADLTLVINGVETTLNLRSLPEKDKKYSKVKTLIKKAVEDKGEKITGEQLDAVLSIFNQEIFPQLAFTASSLKSATSGAILTSQDSYTSRRLVIEGGKMDIITDITYRSLNANDPLKKANLNQNIKYALDISRLKKDRFELGNPSSAVEPKIQISFIGDRKHVAAIDLPYSTPRENRKGYKVYEKIEKSTSEYINSCKENCEKVDIEAFAQVILETSPSLNPDRVRRFVHNTAEQKGAETNASFVSKIYFKFAGLLDRIGGRNTTEERLTGINLIPEQESKKFDDLLISEHSTETHIKEPSPQITRERGGEDLLASHDEVQVDAERTASLARTASDASSISHTDAPKYTSREGIEEAVTSLNLSGITNAEIKSLSASLHSLAKESKKTTKTSLLKGEIQKFIGKLGESDSKDQLPKVMNIIKKVAEKSRSTDIKKDIRGISESKTSEPLSPPSTPPVDKKHGRGIER